MKTLIKCLRFFNFSELAIYRLAASIYIAELAKDWTYTDFVRFKAMVENDICKRFGRRDDGRY